MNFFVRSASVAVDSYGIDVVINVSDPTLSLHDVLLVEEAIIAIRKKLVPEEKE